LSDPQSRQYSVFMRSFDVAELRCILLAVVLAPFTLAQTPAPAPADSLSAARLLFRQGDFKAAAAAFREMIEHQPSPDAYAGLVQSLIKQDDVPAAEESSLKALATLPQSAPIHAARADVLFRRGLIPEAEHEYKAALKLDEQCARAWLGMGRVYSAESRRQRSQEALSKAHELDPEDGDALYHWAVGLAYPKNVAGLETHLAKFRSDPEDERQEREYVEFLKALAGRKVWVPAREISRSEIKLEQILVGPGRVRGVGLKVHFNDTASAKLLLDTGASGISIGHKLAGKIKARRLSDETYKGVGDSGSLKGYMAWVDKITIGDFEFHDCFVHVSSKGGSADEDGLIGGNIFDKYLVTIDFPGNKLRLNPLPGAGTDAGMDAYRGPETATFSQSFLLGHILLLSTRVGDAASGLFALDTGASMNAITPALAKQVGKMHDSNVHVNGLSGSVKSVHATQAILQFSRFSQPSEEINTFDVNTLSKDLGTEVSGFIGFATLKKMKVIIDYRDGLVDFDYKP
jgi:tetratricopeptide (TPR) repeat protein